jgi:hypothetical protein
VAVGLIIMSERELNRIEALSQVTRGVMTAVSAANVLGLSRRQVHRLLKDFQTGGPGAIRHKARGRSSNNRIDPAVREFALMLVRENYLDFGPTFAAKKLAKDHGLKVSHEMLLAIRNQFRSQVVRSCRAVSSTATVGKVCS